MKGGPIGRSETRKEVEDREYLAQLLKTPMLANANIPAKIQQAALSQLTPPPMPGSSSRNISSRMKERLTATPPPKLYIPKTQYVPPSHQPLPSSHSSSSTVSLAAAQHQHQNQQQQGFFTAGTAEILKSANAYIPEPPSLPFARPLSTYSSTSTNSVAVAFFPPSLSSVPPSQQHPYLEPSQDQPVTPFLVEYLRQDDISEHDRRARPPSPSSRPSSALNTMQHEDMFQPLDQTQSHTYLEQQQQQGPSRQISPLGLDSEWPRSPQPPILMNSGETDRRSPSPSASWTDQATRQERLERQVRQDHMLKRSSLLQPVHRSSVPNPAATVAADAAAAVITAAQNRHRSMPPPSQFSPEQKQQQQQQQRRSLLEPTAAASSSSLDRAWSQKWVFSPQDKQWQDHQLRSQSPASSVSISRTKKLSGLFARDRGHSASHDSGVGSTTDEDRSVSPEAAPAIELSALEQQRLEALFRARSNQEIQQQQQEQPQQLPRPLPSTAFTTMSTTASGALGARSDDRVSSYGESWTLNGSDVTLTENWPVANDQFSPNGGKLTKTHWRISGCIPLGLMTFLICLFMLAYNAVLTVLVFQASGYRLSSLSSTPATAYSLAILVFATYFLVSAVTSLLGLLTLTLANLKSTRNSRIGTIFSKIFHILFLSMSLLTTGSMFYWLRLNVQQTGRWDHIRLPPFSDSAIDPLSGSGDDDGLGAPQTPKAPVLSFQSLLSSAGPDFPADEWLISPWVWISVFVVILIAQVYSWLCLLEYARQLEKRAKMARRRRQGGAAARGSFFVGQEKERERTEVVEEERDHQNDYETRLLL